MLGHHSPRASNAGTGTERAPGSGNDATRRGEVGSAPVAHVRLPRGGPCPAQARWSAVTDLRGVESVRIARVILRTRSPVALTTSTGSLPSTRTAQVKRTGSCNRKCPSRGNTDHQSDGLGLDLTDPRCCRALLLVGTVEQDMAGS